MIYKLKFSLLSPLTNMPDSQSVFGAFCHTYMFKNGEDKLVAFLKKVKERKDFLVSSMYYDGMLPKPMNMKLPRIENISLEENRLLKKEKKIKYIDLKLYLEYRKDENKFLNSLRSRIGNELIINDLECLCFKDNNINSVRKASDTRVRNNSQDSNLFYNYVTYYSKDAKYCVYVKADEIKEIDAVLDDYKELSIGSKKSIGYNLFHYDGYESVEELELNKPLMLISKALCDDDIDYIHSSYKVVIDNAKYNNNGEHLFRTSKICLQEGSIIPNRDIIGDIVIEKDNNGDNYQYLLGLMV